MLSLLIAALPLLGCGGKKHLPQLINSACSADPVAATPHPGSVQMTGRCFGKAKSCTKAAGALPPRVPTRANPAGGGCREHRRARGVTGEPGGDVLVPCGEKRGLADRTGRGEVDPRTLTQRTGGSAETPKPFTSSPGGVSAGARDATRPVRGAPALRSHPRSPLRRRLRGLGTPQAARGWLRGDGDPFWGPSRLPLAPHRSSEAAPEGTGPHPAVPPLSLRPFPRGRGSLRAIPVPARLSPDPGLARGDTGAAEPERGAERRPRSPVAGGSPAGRRRAGGT